MNSFEDVSVTQRLRIMGDDVRLFRWEPLQACVGNAHVSAWLGHVLSTSKQLLGCVPSISVGLTCTMWSCEMHRHFLVTCSVLHIIEHRGGRQSERIIMAMAICWSGSRAGPSGQPRRGVA